MARVENEEEEKDLKVDGESDHLACVSNALSEASLLICVSADHTES